MSGLKLRTFVHCLGLEFRRGLLRFAERLFRQIAGHAPCRIAGDAAGQQVGRQPGPEHQHEAAGPERKQRKRNEKNDYPQRIQKRRRGRPQPVKKKPEKR